MVTPRANKRASSSGKKKKQARAIWHAPLASRNLQCCTFIPEGANRQEETQLNRLNGAGFVSLQNVSFNLWQDHKQ